jgi:hypothetical protein
MSGLFLALKLFSAVKNKKPGAFLKNIPPECAYAHPVKIVI